MCFVFVFAALLEYAAVNYTFWGARAKKKVIVLFEIGCLHLSNFHCISYQSKKRENNGPSHHHHHPAGSVETANNSNAAGNNAAEAARVDDDEGIIQLHDLRLSPIPSLRNRHSSRSANKVVGGPPSLRFVRRHYHHHHSCSKYFPAKRSSSNKNSKTSGCSQSARSEGDDLFCGLYSLPKIKDVNLIDKYSRFVFPAAFAIFNAVYWTIYALL